MNRRGILDDYPLVRTDNFEELRAALACIVSIPLLEPMSRDRALGAVQNLCDLGGVGISYGRYDAAVRFGIPEPKIISQIYPIDGTAEVTVDGTTVTVDADCGATVSAGAAEYGIVNAPGYERLIMLVDEGAACAKLSALLGDAVQGPLALQPRHELNEPLARSLRRNFMFLVAQLNAGIDFPPLVLAEFEQTLMVMFLHANRHRYTDRLRSEPLQGSARQVRQVEEYIEANWFKPIDMEALVAVGGLGICSLVSSFRRTRGYLPGEFLTRVRLRHARALLLKSDTAATVSDIATLCGFRNREHFSAAYARAFGEHPDDTLVRGQSSRPH